MLIYLLFLVFVVTVLYSIRQSTARNETKIFYISTYVYGLIKNVKNE